MTMVFDVGETATQPLLRLHWPILTVNIKDPDADATVTMTTIKNPAFTYTLHFLVQINPI